MKHEDAYTRLRQSLSIDLLRIDEELIEMPQLVQDIAEYTAEATFARDKAKIEWEIAQAQAAKDARQRCIDAGTKFTVDQISNEVMLDPDVREAQADYEQSKLDADMWGALIAGARTKSSSLKHASELIASGYLTPNAIKAERRQQMHTRRTLRATG